MRLMQRLAGLLVFFALSATLLIRIDPAFAQGSIADSGLQILQGLSSEQRDAISQQLGGAGLGGQQGTIGARQQPTNEVQQSLMLQQQRELLMDSQKQRAEMQRLSPFLQGEDWVVITVDSNPLPVGNQAPTATPQAGTLGALGGVTNAQQQNILGNLAPALAASQGGQSGPGAGTGGAGQSGVAAATAAAMTPSPAQNVTAGGYALMPPSCSGQPNCDPSQPTRPELTDEEKKQRQVLIDLIRSKNPYQLSRDGVLALPGFAPIPLAGLTEQLATLRLGVEPALRDLFIRVTKLPLEKVGATAWKPFGYELFDRQISTFAPATNVPVPADYLVGPGDELDVQLYGNKNGNLKLTVGRDGLVNFPQLGPISVSGQTFKRDRKSTRL